VTRYAEVGKTLIHGIKNKVCKSIIGLDANSLYLKCQSEYKPVGIPIIYKPIGNVMDAKLDSFNLGSDDEELTDFEEMEEERTVSLSTYFR
jgi:hypothetical protein